MAIELKGLNRLIKKLDNLSDIKTEDILTEVAIDMQDKISERASKISEESSNYVGVVGIRKYNSSCFIDVGIADDVTPFELWKSLWFQHWGFNNYGLNFTGQYYISNHKNWFDEAINDHEKEATRKIKSKLQQEVRKAIS